jgi:hypothetical protein
MHGPRNGLPFNQRVHLEGYSANTTFNYSVIGGYIYEAQNFMTEMKKGNWSRGFNKYDDALKISDLRASGANIFNQVKLGLLMLHGSYGTTADFTANQCQQIYFPITSGSSAEYLRMSQMNLGSADANGLKWMAIAACNSLRGDNWQSMQNAGIVPFNGNLHLLLGTDSVVWTSPHVTSYWAKYMLKGANGPPMGILDAWYQGPHDAYAETHFNYTNTMIFSASGDSACQDDKLQTYSDPGGTSFYNNLQVWP